MRYLYAGILGLLAHLAHGQALPDSLRAAETAVPTAEVARRVSSRVDSAGTCTEVLQEHGAGGLLRVFYASGRLKEYVPYADLAAGHIHGIATTWYENGQLCSREPYLQGQREGTLLLYYANGQLKRETQYVAGAELPGRCFDPAGAAVPYFLYEQLPLYPGGHAQLTKEITRALRVPRTVAPLVFWQPLQVDIGFWVGKDGRVGNPRVVVSSRVPALDQAVLAAVAKLTKRFHPGLRDGQAVRWTYHLPILLGSNGYAGQPQKL